MSSVASYSANPPSRALQGILCVEIGMLFFVGQDAMMKSLLTIYPVWMLISIRALVTVILMVPAILILGKPHRLLTPLWPLHLLRALLFSVGFSLFYAAFPFMGLAEVTTIFFAAPLMTALLAAFWLKETIGIHRISALVVGFVGVVIAMNPAGDTFTWIVILPLISALAYAISQIIARQIGDRESTLTVGLYTLAPAGIMILVMGWTLNQLVDFGPEFSHLRWAFPSEALTDIPHLFFLGAIGMAGYTLLSRAYQIANASLVAPFDYTYLPMAGVLAYIMWGEVPPTATLAGMGLIILSGLYIGYREVANSRKSNDQTVLAEAIFAPGNPLPPQGVNDEGMT